MGDPIAAVEQALEQAGRSCLRLIGTRSLSLEQSRKLAKWTFGCMNQRYTIRERVEKRGPGELKRVLDFVARTWDDPRAIDEGSQGSNK
jgi:hypothetical protein